MTKIFDSATHPTITGKWHNKKNYNATFKILVKEMKKNKIYRACAMGLDNFEGYNHELFISECKKYKNLIPIAGLNPNHKNLDLQIKRIKDLGYRGIKIHPRYSNIKLDKKSFRNFLNKMEDKQLVLMICTYEHAKIGNHQNENILDILYDTFQNIKNLKTILVHGGNVNILNYSEFVRNNRPNFLLDLSMTMQKYKGSSIETDIHFLFKNFDENICVGSDHPELSLNKLRKDFEYYSKKLSQKKKNNIAYKNLNNFFNLND